MSAAMEAALESIRSIGFSLLDYSFDADFEPAKPYIRKIMEYMLARPFQHGYLLNVNIPKLASEQIRGLKVCRQADARWIEKMIEGRDPAGRPYYWLSGDFVNNDHAEDTDIWALENGYISVVPSMHDLTNYPAIPVLKDLE
jgi:5'-nucleotidase